MTRSVSVAVRAHGKIAARALPLAIIAALRASSVAAFSSALGESVLVGRIDEQPGVADRLGQRAGGGGDHGHAAGHRLEAGQPEAFVARGHRQRAGAGVEPREVLFGHVSEAPHAGVATAEIAAVGSGHHEVDPELLQ